MPYPLLLIDHKECTTGKNIYYTLAEKHQINWMMYNCNESSVAKDHVKMKVISPDVKVNSSTSANQNLTVKAKSQDKGKEKIHTRRLMLKTLWNGVAIFCLGMTISMKGPSFMDLQLIAGTDVEGGSVFFTVFAFGYMMGSLVGGSLYKRVKSKALLMLFPMVLAALACAATPFCDNYMMMAMVHLLEAVFSSIFDTTANTAEVHRWEGRSDSAMQFLSFAYSFGGIIGPLLVQPFLAPENSTSRLGISPVSTQDALVLQTHGGYNGQQLPPFPTSTNSSAPYSIGVRNDTAMASIMPHNISQPQANGVYGGETVVIAAGLISSGVFSVNCSHGAATSMDGVSVVQQDATFIEDRYRSRIYIPYIIAAALKVLAAMPFVFIYLRTQRKAAVGKGSAEQRGDQHLQKLPTKVYISLIGLLSMFYFFYTAVDDPFSMYLPVFLVKHMSWSKETGALIVAVYWICGTVTKLLMVLLVRHVNASVVMFLSALGMVLSTALFILFTSLQAHELVWVASSMLAISQSAIFGGAFAWTDSNLLRLDGRVTSFTLCFAALGGMVDPMLIGVSMKELSPMAFPILMFGQSVILFLLFLTMLLVARPYVFRRFGPPHGSSTVTVGNATVVSDNGEEEDDEDGGVNKNWLAGSGQHNLESVTVKTDGDLENQYSNSSYVNREKDVIDKLLHDVNSHVS